MLQTIEEVLGILAAVAALALLSRKLPIPYPIVLVIGGLAFATVTTLFVVPIIYTYLRTKPPIDHDRRLEQAERGAEPLSV